MIYLYLIRYKSSISGKYQFSKMRRRQSGFVYDFFYLLYDVIVYGSIAWSLVINTYKFTLYNCKPYYILLHEYTGMHYTRHF